ncbi:hypothetical protein SeH_A1901 [Salmonella enterica subsp. enterica serovar Hadar str. RI_05P066]|uniref:Uncharacterized protein n=1 Tax=Salmonella newport (strain SL254) TaxID=423368 RepID=A0A0H3BNQ6_SALNS|nr:hypothetical protein SNSL254_A2001 [Salmonella enterica subsp. enterica serovar Newport str. SL254]AGS29918.1 hypothetical protein SN31241_29460 [Salmonella enterica subsp. enterica serovar Newport str. USMARC-S3124.1]ALP97727.1 hypothetical protein FORC20_1950 [Salmonella enterica subsp. enterica serovar Typhimurium]EDZ37732.1 hypothetical protein SeH_A1901 [Salmonella enterica subsp. enterica serovar Hadar str. RI_05P066]
MFSTAKYMATIVMTITTKEICRFTDESLLHLSQDSLKH